MDRLSGAIFGKWAKTQHSSASKIRFYVNCIVALVGFIMFCVLASRSSKDKKAGDVYAFVSPGTETAQHFAKGIAFPRLTVCSSPFSSKPIKVDVKSSMCHYIPYADLAPGIELAIEPETNIVIELPDGKMQPAGDCFTVMPSPPVLGTQPYLAHNDTETIRCDFKYEQDVATVGEDPIVHTWEDFVFGTFWGGDTHSDSWELDGPPKHIGHWKTFNAYTFNLINMNVVGFSNSKHKEEGYFYKSDLAHTSNTPIYDDSQTTGQTVIPAATIINFSFDTYFYQEMANISKELFPASTMWGVAGGWWFMLSCMGGFVTFLIFSVMGLSDEQSSGSLGGNDGYVSTPPPSYANATYNASSNNTPFDNTDAQDAPAVPASKDGYGSI